MLKETLPNLYKIEVPLPNNPLKALNSYIFKTPDRNLIIDTGMNREECSRVIFSAYKQLGIELDKTDFFITHMHADHSGLVARLATETSRVFCSSIDAAVILATDSWDNVLKGACLHGFPEHELQTALARHPGYKYASRGQIEFTIVREGDEIGIGDYVFRCVETPGHTKGHMCLYEPAKKLLISGDHILGDITPNISLFIDAEGNPLQEYLQSLDKIDRLDIELVLPGHRSTITNCRKRIVELKQHHLARAGEVMAILEKGSANAYTVASQMSWEIDCPTWEQFPTPQKWFATGEAIAHLKYLEDEGRVQKVLKDQVFVYTIS